MEQLRALLCRVRDAGALDDNQGAEDWSFSDKVIDEAISALADTLRIVGEEILDSLGEDDNIEEWKDGVRLKIMKAFTK